MTREEVWQTVAAGLRDNFGRLLDVRDVRRVRRVSGDAWTVTVVLAAASGDLHVADLTVDDRGAISPTLGWASGGVGTSFASCSFLWVFLSVNVFAICNGNWVRRRFSPPGC